MADFRAEPPPCGEGDWWYWPQTRPALAWCEEEATPWEWDGAHIHVLAPQRKRLHQRLQTAGLTWEEVSA